MLDTNQDGMVNGEELRDMLSRLGLKDVINDTLITSLISDATRNGADLITEEQFLEWMPKLGLCSELVQPECKSNTSSTRKPSLNNNSKCEDDENKEGDEDAEKDLRAAFAVFDMDHNGYY